MTRPGAHRMLLPAAIHTAASGYMAARLGDVRGAATALRLMQSGLAGSTSRSYGRLFDAFADYCTGEGVSPLPASIETVVAYVGYLAEAGTWAESSMQPIFSAINDAHRSLGMEPPARDSFFLQRTRAGLGRVQAAVATTDSRTPLPAEAPLAFLAAAEAAPDAGLQRIRGLAALVLTALFAGRQDTCVLLRSADVGVSAEEIWLRLSEKGRKHTSVRRIMRLPLTPLSTHGHPSALPRVGDLLRRYFELRRRAAPSEPEFAFQLPGEVRPTTASEERWLAQALRDCGIAAPAGFAYQGHSLRSLGASAMAAIGVPRHIYIWIGGWARGSSVVDRCYIDPTFTPSPAAYALYGWALQRHFTAGSGSPAVRVPLPDPRCMAPAPGPTLPDAPPHAHVHAACAIRRRLGI